MDTSRHEARDPLARVYDVEDDGFGGRFADEYPHDADFGCLFPIECCMPELHFTSECHTAETAEEMHGYAALAEAGEDGRGEAVDAQPEQAPRTGVLPDDGIPF